MSAWEGSAWQIAQEQEKSRFENAVNRIQAQNPWLSRQDCERWQREQDEKNKPKPKCCPCQGLSAGIVRHQTGVGGPAYTLGPCECGCHQSRPR